MASSKAEFASKIRQGLAYPDRIAVADHHANWTWAQLVDRVDELCEQFRPYQGKSIGVRLPSSLDAYAALAALDLLGCTATLFDNQTPMEQTNDVASQLRIDGTLIPMANESQYTWSLGEYQPDPSKPTSPPSLDSRVIILTSGTQGKPKPAVHTWRSLCRPVRTVTNDAPQSWLLSYRVHLYAGLQVALQCLLNHGSLVIPAPDSSPDRVAQMMIQNRVEYGSATPSYWRRFLMLMDKSDAFKISLKQITLGGEPIDQQILDQLRFAFPKARLVHIYATTELGRCFAVSDGQAGFPVAFLNQVTPDQVAIKVEQGQLFVRSANAMLEYYQARSETTSNPTQNDWFATGDLVEIKGDRVYFAGRMGDAINVGGNKVNPLMIEDLIRQSNGVADVRVFGRPSSLTGQIVACELVLQDGHQEETTRRDVLTICNQQLASHQRPRFIEFVKEIAVTGAGKKERRSIS